jgi:hypothetical protein
LKFKKQRQLNCTEYNKVSAIHFYTIDIAEFGLVERNSLNKASEAFWIFFESRLFNFEILWE